MASAAAQKIIDDINKFVSATPEQKLASLNRMLAAAKTPTEKAAVQEAISTLSATATPGAAPGASTDPLPGSPAYLALSPLQRIEVDARRIQISDPTRKPSNKISPSKGTRGAILGGLDQKQDPVTGEFTTSYVPPMWYNGGSHERDAAHPFNTNKPNFGGEGVQDWYRENDQWEPLNKPETIPDIQEKLIAAGLYDNPDAIRRGMWTALDANAYGVALGIANRQGIDITTALKMLADHPAMATVQLSSSVDVASIADSVIPNVIGRRLSKAETNRLIGAWHKVQQDYASQPQQIGGTAEAPPSLGTFAEQWAEGADPGAAQGNKTVGALTMLHNALKGAM